MPQLQLKMAERGMKCWRHFRYFSRHFSLGSRFLLNASENPNESKTQTMFEFYKKNPEFLKQRERMKIEFNLEKQVSEEKGKERREPPAIEPENATWTEGCKRAGAIGVKLGMMPLWLKNGERVPVTLVQVLNHSTLSSHK